MDEKQQELIFKLSIFEQQFKQIQQQLQAVEHGILEMNSLSLGLGELGGSINKEILAPIGRGIFVKAKLLSEKLRVDVGNGNFVEKEIPDVQKMIQKQIEKLDEVKKELNDGLEKIGEEMGKVMGEGKS